LWSQRSSIINNLSIEGRDKKDGNSITSVILAALVIKYQEWTCHKWNPGLKEHVPLVTYLVERHNLAAKQQNITLFPDTIVPKEIRKPTRSFEIRPVPIFHKV
jgi:hypothetical protein